MNQKEEFMSQFACPQPDFLPQSIEQEYEFLSCLANKETRLVYLVRDKMTKKKAVLKISLPQSPDNVKREYEILEKLSHPGIPKALWYEKDDCGREYLLRSYLSGITLDKYLDETGLLGIEKLLEITLKLCDIIAYLHQQKPAVIYRDIKPQNIVLLNQGEIGLIDFGISRLENKTKNFDTVYVGSVAFAAPEQFGFTKTDFRTDIFALGKLMLYMCTGETDSNACDLEAVPSELSEIIAKCIQLSPEKRYASTKKLSKALNKIINPPLSKKLFNQAAIAIVLAVFMIWGLPLWVVSITANHVQDQALMANSNELGVVSLQSDLLIRAARKSLSLSDSAPLTEENLSKVTKLAIASEGARPSLIEPRIIESFQLLTLPSTLLVDQNTYFTDWDELRHFPNLKELTLSGLHIVNIPVLSGLELEKLNISHNEIMSLAPLQTMPTLQTLDISYNPLINIAPLATLNALNSLDLSYTQVRDLSVLEKLSNLQTLLLRSTKSADYAVLGKLRQLENLQINNVIIKDYSFLIQLDKLNVLELSSTRFADLDKINSRRLQALDISMNYNFITKIEELQRFPELIALDISFNNISDYSPLSNCLKLKTLAIHQGQIEEENNIVLSDIPLKNLIVLNHGWENNETKTTNIDGFTVIHKTLANTP